MHTVYMVLGGLAALAAALLLGRAFGGMAVLPLIAKVFIGLWLLVALGNLWLGVSHGYTVMQELPFLVAVFGVPAAAAALVWWKLS